MEHFSPSRSISKSFFSSSSYNILQNCLYTQQQLDHNESHSGGRKDFLTASAVFCCSFCPRWFQSASLESSGIVLFVWNLCQPCKLTSSNPLSLGSLGNQCEDLHDCVLLKSIVFLSLFPSLLRLTVHSQNTMNSVLWRLHTNNT